uniref:hypothetical protein n=1 Tax=Ndongobacter massiliensis TaxID=1871025 RepID=UPI0009317F99|nr:hypothetical protein [Ndongobacter massiliensis]
MNKSADIYVNVDKTVVRITGISVKGLNINQLEALLQEKLKSMVRIIGVTGDSLEMDLYGVEEESILRNAEGLVHAISLADGITITDLTELSHVEKIKSVDIDHIPAYEPNGCQGMRWHNEV